MACQPEETPRTQPTIADGLISEMAEAPASVSTDEGSVSERSISDLIAADRYEAAKQANRRPPWGMTIARVIPGSAVGGGYRYRNDRFNR